MKQLLLISALCTMQVLCYAQGNTGLIGHWNFNGNANDKSGHGLNGVVTGATLTTGYNNIPNTAYLFTGFDQGATYYDNITVPYDSLLNLQDFSICTMVNLDSFNKAACQTNSILWRGNQGNSSFYMLEINDNTYPGDNSCNIYTPAKMSFLGETGDMYVTVNPLSRGYTHYATTNTWYCVTTTYSNDTLKMYIDGVLKHAIYYHRTAQKSTEPLRMGASFYAITQGASHPYPFFGKMDDIRLYSRALTFAEVGQYCDSVKWKIGDPPIDTTDTTDHPPIDTTLHIGNNIPLQPFITPNPTQHEINVWFPATDSKGYVQLVNAVGQVLAQQPIQGDKLQFNMDAYSQGMYLLKIQYNGQLMFKKFLKQ